MENIEDVGDDEDEVVADAEMRMTFQNLLEMDSYVSNALSVDIDGRHNHPVEY